MTAANQGAFDNFALIGDKFKNSAMVVAANESLVYGIPETRNENHLSLTGR